MTSFVPKYPLHILLDKGSTHMFLVIQVAKKVGCTIVEFDLVMVTVADGSRSLSLPWLEFFQGNYSKQHLHLMSF